MISINELQIGKKLFFVSKFHFAPNDSEDRISEVFVVSVGRQDVFLLRDNGLVSRQPIGPNLLIENLFKTSDEAKVAISLKKDVWNR